MAGYGGRVIAADAFGHEALRRPEIRDAVAARWGAGVLDEHGQVSRRKLGAVVFADPAQRRELEALVFPWIERRIREELARAGEDPAVRFVVLDAAIMLETGWGDVCDRVVYVDAPRAARAGRLAARSGWSEAEVLAREAAQMPPEEKARRADAVIDNSGPPEALRPQVEELLRRWGLLAPGG